MTLVSYIQLAPAPVLNAVLRPPPGAREVRVGLCRVCSTAWSSNARVCGTCKGRLDAMIANRERNTCTECAGVGLTPGGMLICATCHGEKVTYGDAELRSLRPFQGVTVLGTRR